MKKTLKVLSSWFLVLSMILGSITFHAEHVHASSEGTVSLETETTEVFPGDEITVDVVLGNNPGLINIQFSVNYDNDSLKLTSATDTGLFPGQMLPKISDKTKSPYKCTWADDTAEENITENGVIAELTFTVKETASAGDYSIEISYDPSDAFFDYDWNLYEPEVKGIEIHVHGLEKVDQEDPTCTEVGYVEHYTCNSCGKYFADANGSVVLEKVEEIPTLSHDMTKTDAQEATHFADGNIEYYTCSMCEKIYADEAGNTVITLEDTVLDMIPHNHS